MEEFVKLNAYKTPDLSIVVPCYNEDCCLLELQQRIDSVSSRLEKSYELILVNDGSGDRTWEVIQKLCDSDCRVIGVNLSRNFGQEASVLAGLGLSRGEFTLVIDADLQDPPELLGPMLALMDKGADVVYGERTVRHGETRYKRVTAWAFYRIMEWLAEVPVPRNTGTFRLIRRNALDVINAMPEHANYLRGLVSWVGFRQVPILYERQTRFAGQSSWPTTKMVRLAINAVVTYSFKPLRFAYLFTGLLMLISTMLALYVIGAFVYGSSALAVATSATLFVLTATASLQTLLLGIIGEYVRQALIESRNRPRFIVADLINHRQIKGPCHV